MEAVGKEELLALVETGGVDVSFVVLPADEEPFEMHAADGGPVAARRACRRAARRAQVAGDRRPTSPT